MFDALIDGLLLVLQWKSFLYLLIGAAIGFWVGILPGLGGATTLALMLPFIYKMTPQEAFPFLLGMHSVVATTGDITSVLFGIPGSQNSESAYFWKRLSHFLRIVSRFFPCHAKSIV